MANKTEKQQDEDVLVADREEAAQPKMFKVMLLNDDYTSMDFVVSILEQIFSKSPAEATQIMMAVHKSGRGLCGIYAKQIAETKVLQVHDESSRADFPLRCVMEEV